MAVDANLKLNLSFKRVKTSPKATFRNFFHSTMALSIWALSEILLIVIGILYFHHIYGTMQLILLFRFLIVLVALLRLYQVIQMEKAVAKSLISKS